MFSGGGRIPRMTIVRSAQGLPNGGRVSEQSVVTFFDSGPRVTRLTRVLEMNYIQPEEDSYESDEWFESCEDDYEFKRLSSSEFSTRPSGSFYNSPRHCIADLKESDAERKGRLLQEEKQIKDKAEKKRIKKKRQKERKQRDKEEKEKVMMVKEGEDGLQKPAAKENATMDACQEQCDLSTEKTDQAAGRMPEKDANSSQCESSDEDDNLDGAEELDFSSTFVSKAAEIAMRKLDQKAKPEPKVKKSQNKCKALPDKLKDDTKEQDSEAHVISTLEENIKRSNELALIGNQYANIGDFKMAVKFFTDAVKYNPTEFKLFGNRSFCYEKLQDYERALADAELCLSISPRWVKGLFRQGRALAGLKRYGEASQAFREVLKLDMKCTEAAQELMRVQIIQLMEYGYTRERSTNALIIHRTFDKALEALSQLNQNPKVTSGIFPRPQVISATGVSPVLSANPSLPSPHTPYLAANVTPAKPARSRTISPTVKTDYGRSHQVPKELFPVWVGNVTPTMTELSITDLFQSAGKVHSVKLLTGRRCAFVNFTKPEETNEAIRRFNGFILEGSKLAVRYPDRLPPGMGISKSAVRAPPASEEHQEFPVGGIQFRRSSSASRPDYKAAKQY